MPHGQSLPNLRRIARVIGPYDIVGLQEADAGSFRTGFIDQARYLADNSGFAYCTSMITRDLGLFAQHTNSILTRMEPISVSEHRLPGALEGRGALEACFLMDGHPFRILVTHTSLGRRARMRQLGFLAELVANSPSPCIIMGDLNCTPRSKELNYLRTHTRLQLPSRPSHATLPSWRPRVTVDYILATPEFELRYYGPLPELYSDHLPVQARACWIETRRNPPFVEQPSSRRNQRPVSP